MDAFNWLLLNGADALLALWGLIKVVLGSIFAALDVVLNPVLSPALAALNPICTTIGDGVYTVLSPLPVWCGLTILSAVTGLVMLVAFRYTSNQIAIGRAKDDIKANLLALKLYKDDLGVTFRCQGRLFLAIARLQRYMLTPVLVMLAPMLLGLAQMGVRYQWRPLQPGERTLLRLHIRPAQQLREGAVGNVAVQLEPCLGLDVEAGPVPGGGQLVWRVRGTKPGRYMLRFHTADNVIEKELVVGKDFQRVSAARIAPDWTAQIFHPTERRLPSDSPFESIEILYPSVDSLIYGADWWVLYFFIVSMITALVFKPLFKVRF